MNKLIPDVCLCVSFAGGPTGPGAEPVDQGPVPGPGGAVRRHGSAAGLCRALVPEPLPIRRPLLLHHPHQVECTRSQLPFVSPGSF